MEKEFLISELQKWDGKHTAFLKAVYTINNKNPLFIDDLISIYSTNAELEHAATWLIKHHIDLGERLHKEKLGHLLKKLGKLNHWESQLHVLQLVPKVTITQEHAQLIEPEVRKLLQSEKKFVKAVAYEAYFEVVKLFPELNNEFLLICEDAFEKESASVRSKLKKLITAMHKSM